MGKYKRKGEKGLHISEEKMLAAIKKILKKEITFAEASKRYGISQATLYCRLKNVKAELGSLDPQELPLESGIKNRNKNCKYASNQVFTNEEENAIVEYLLICSKINDGLTMDAIRESGYRLAVCWDIKFPGNWAKNEMAGKDWALGFIRRHKDLPPRKQGKKSVHDLEKEGIKVQNKWKWYDTSSFLEELKELGLPNRTPKDDNLEKTLNQPDSGQASSSSTITLKSFAKMKNSTDRSEDDQSHSSNSNQLDSTNEIYIVDPDTGIGYKTEDEELDSLHLQTDSAVDVLSPEPESEEEDPISDKPRPAKLSKSERKFLIDGVCSSVTFQLSNEKLCEDDLVAFHSDLITYMNSYFNKRRRK